MKDLVERILKTRAEIDVLTREKNAIVNKIEKKKLLLTDLEKLTVNQIDLFEDNV